MKAHVVQMGKGNGSVSEQLQRAWGQKAAKLHLSYLARDGVDLDGSAGALYDAQGPVDRVRFNEDLPDEEHQFRLIVSPEDGHAIDLQTFVRDYMEQVQRDLGRELRWAAADHYNTDQPHAHIVIRGIDARGAKVRLEREYVSHGLRRRAEELVTERLGPRPERTRLDQLRREVERERYTSLDRELERRAQGGLYRLVTGSGRDPNVAAIFRERLMVLEGLGLASVVGRGEWRLDPDLRSRLQVLGRYAEGMSVIRSVVRASRGRVLDRTEQPNASQAELDRGAFAVVRWKGLDEDGRFVAVVETTSGVAYHLPVTSRAAANIRVGQVLEIKRAVDKDARIEEAAAANGRRYDLDVLPEEYRGAYRKRLEQLERLNLAQPAGKSVWILKENFRAQAHEGKPQAYWQMLSLIADPQPLAAQRRFAGFVGLDRIPQEQSGPTGFGKEVRDAIAERHEYLRELGLDPQSPKLRWELRELQRSELERTLAASTGRTPVRAHEGFRGVVHVNRSSNGESFLIVHSKDGFAVVPGSHKQVSLEGQDVRLQIGTKGRVQVLPVAQYELQHQKRQAQALAQIAAVAPGAAKREIIDGTTADGAATELDAGVRGIVRWVGADDRGAPHAVVETLSGTAYSLPVSAAVAASTSTGQLVEIQRAPNTDERLRQTALQNDRVCDLATVTEAARSGFRRRLEELERLRLATREGEGQWRLSESFLRSKAPGPPRPVWLRAEARSLDDQKKHPGFAWLDRARGAELADSGFGATVREALRDRDAHLRGLGIDPDSKNLRWNLRDTEQRQLEQSIASTTGLVPIRPHEGFRGVAHVHRATDGQVFVAVRGKDGFALVPASRQQASLEGQDVRMLVGAKGRIEVLSSDDYELHRQQRLDQALAQIAAIVPGALRREVIDGGTRAGGAATELDVGVLGIVRWVGSDGRGDPHAVIETPSGTVYHVPLTANVASSTRTGQLVEMQRAPNTDERIRQSALKNGGVYDLVHATEAERHGSQRRLEALERQHLATRIREGQWRLSESLLRTDAPRPRPIWLRAENQTLDDQRKSPGYVWLDRARHAELAESGFGATLREALRDRDARLRELGVDPDSKHLRWKLRELQHRQLGKALEAAGNARLVPVRNGFEGTVHLHEATNGERFVEIRGSSGRFALLQDSRGAEALLGRTVRVELRDRGRPRLQLLDRGLER